MATCQREAPAAHRRVSTGSMATAGSRWWHRGLRQLRASASTDVTRGSPACAPALTETPGDHARSSTAPHSRHTTPRASSRDTDPTRRPDLKAERTQATAAPPPRAAFLPRTTLTIDWLPLRVHRSWPRASSPRCSGGRVTQPLTHIWRRTARSGRTGSESGGRSGSCCRQTTPTRCLRLWCELQLHLGLLSRQSPPRPPLLHFICPPHLPFLVPCMMAPWCRCLHVQLLPSTSMSHDFFLFCSSVRGCLPVCPPQIPQT